MGQDRKTHEVDLLSLIPADTKSILQINKFDRFSLQLDSIITDSADEDMLNWFVTLNRFISPLKKEAKSLSQKENGYLLVSFHDEGDIYYAKLHPEEIDIWKKMLEKNVFPPFPPEIQRYEGIDILHYTLADDRFFSCIFKGGIFVGSFNNKLIEKVIRSWKEGNSIKNDARFVQISKTGGTTTDATLFYYIRPSQNMFLKDTTSTNFPIIEGWTSSDITFMDNEVWFSGYYKPTNEVNRLERSTEDNEGTILFHPQLFTPGIIFSESVNIDLNTIRSNHNSGVRPVSYFSEENFSPDSLFLRFTGDEIHTLYMENSTSKKVSKIYCLKIQEREFFEKDFYKCLYSIPGYKNVKQLYLKDTTYPIISLKNINLLNDVFCGKFFPENPNNYLSFFNDYLIVSQDEQALNLYLQNLSQPQSESFSQLAKNLGDECHVALLGDIDLIDQTTASPLELGGVLAKYPVFFSEWKFGVHITNSEKDLVFYHIVLGKK